MSDSENQEQPQEEVEAGEEVAQEQEEVVGEETPEDALRNLLKKG